MEKRSISVSASNTAFIPLELSTCLQNLQHRMDTHRSLKLQLPVDMAAREGEVSGFENGNKGKTLPSLIPPQAEKQMARPRAFLNPKIGREMSSILSSREMVKGIFIE